MWRIKWLHVDSIFTHLFLKWVKNINLSPPVNKKGRVRSWILGQYFGWVRGGCFNPIYSSHINLVGKEKSRQLEVRHLNPWTFIYPFIYTSELFWRAEKEKEKMKEKKRLILQIYPIISFFHVFSLQVKLLCVYARDEVWIGIDRSGWTVPIQWVWFKRKFK